MKVVAEQRRGRLLGAQIVGGEGAAKRIDVLATAIWNEMTVDEIDAARPRLRAAVLAGVGPGADRGPPDLCPAPQQRGSASPFNVLLKKSTITERRERIDGLTSPAGPTGCSPWPACSTMASWAET